MATTTVGAELTAEDLLAEYSIPPSSVIYLPPTKLCESFLQHSYNQWQQNNSASSQFIGVSNINSQGLGWLDTHGHRELPSMRILYDQDVEKLVIKLVNRAQDFASREFFNAFFDAAKRIGITRHDLKDAATGRVVMSGTETGPRRQKEPDG
ncbi:hypothetical protein AJ80_02048 [Polytolypa hystricis UAMH7299]|uniref:Uncharacterized protein n=1 Tax=Polytolypa hystricis (strain UAMH7299) TaxID=1447883 RepID=A0A2B7YQN2_POLH7|nr:hypothetical protein AJ80_02048 [Polytolypa hystricis UAMH7299]